MGQQIERAHVGHDQAVKRLDGVFLTHIDFEFLERAFAADLNQDRGGGWWTWGRKFDGGGTGYYKAKMRRFSHSVHPHGGAGFGI
jgi:hypothetical protein